MAELKVATMVVVTVVTMADSSVAWKDQTSAVKRVA